MGYDTILSNVVIIASTGCQPYMQLPTDFYREKLIEVLSGDLDFHDQQTYASHNFHSFPAKFPPQLPAVFINSLTVTGDVVLDPMNGSGTSTLEAFILKRKGIGFDIDPLALKIANVKTTTINPDEVYRVGAEIVSEARRELCCNKHELGLQLKSRWDRKTKEFIDYWFIPNIQLELLALLIQIEKIQKQDIRNFFELAFSAIVITKSGGVSLALDLAHTRPHKPKIIIGTDGQVIDGVEFITDTSNKMRILTKRLRSPIDEFEKRVEKNIRGLPNQSKEQQQPFVSYGNTQNIPLPNNSVDLIITSPPYASNAIDYMRAHKFSLVWLGYNITELGELRGKYVGGEAATNQEFEDLPSFTQRIVEEISFLDRKKGLALQRYYSEMTRALREMYRVLKPGKSAIVVVGSSVMKNRDTETQNCLADIGKVIGFEVPKIGIRILDRDRRMLPAGMEINRNSQIQQRMHEEYVIGYYKPS